MTRRDAAFWGAVAIAGVVGVVLVKIASAQPWAPESLRRFGGLL